MYYYSTLYTLHTLEIINLTSGGQIDLNVACAETALVIGIESIGSIL